MSDSNALQIIRTSKIRLDPDEMLLMPGIALRGHPQLHKRIYLEPSS